MMRNFFWCLLIIGFFLNADVLAQPELDTTFGSGGTSVINFGALAGAQDIAVQSDNKIIMVSSCNHIQLSRVPFCAIRVNENGTFDSSFRNNNPTNSPGVLTIFDASQQGVAMGVVIQSDGKVVVSGWVPGNNGSGDVALVRYNTNGTEDSSFGSGGKVLTDVTPSSTDRGERVALQPDGKIVVVGTTSNALFVARYLTDGTLDDTFGKGGIAQAIVPGMSAQGRSIAIQPDGKIVAGGLVVESGSYLLTRFNADGSTDTTWDSDGIQTVPGTSVGLGIRSVGIQLDGRVVALGHGRILFCFNSNGSLDTGFDVDGSRPVLSGTDKEPYSMLVSASGKITVVGTGIPPACQFGFPCPTPDLRFFTARYRPDGSLDTAYSGDGFLEIDVAGPNVDGARAIAVDPIGRVVVGGLSSTCCVRTYWEQPQYSAARLSAPPVTFVSVTGRVVRADGTPVGNATVSTQGMTSRTNPFGYYTFFNVPTNQTYTFSVRTRDLLIPKRAILVDGEIANLDFFGQHPEPDSSVSIGGTKKF